MTIDTASTAWETALLRLTTSPATSLRKAAKTLGCTPMTVRTRLLASGYHWDGEARAWVRAEKISGK